MAITSAAGKRWTCDFASSFETIKQMLCGEAASGAYQMRRVATLRCSNPGLLSTSEQQIQVKTGKTKRNCPACIPNLQTCREAFRSCENGGLYPTQGISCIPISGLPLLYRKVSHTTMIKPTTLAENQPMFRYYPWSRINAEWYPCFAKLDERTPW